MVTDERGWKVIKVAVVGASGYAGQELLRLLVQHPDVEITAIASQSNAGKSYSNVYPSFKTFIDKVCVEENIAELAKSVEVIFFALPHGATAQRVTQKLIDQVRVIDLGSDFRLKDPAAYDRWYGVAHPHPELLPKSVYGLCEIHREAIKSARLVASPGCYATCAILALYPLLKRNLVDRDSLIVDAKSGVSGAGRSVNLGVHFDEVDENFKAYKVASHRHTPEMEQELSKASGEKFKLTFIPHLVPMNRGILVTAYGALHENLKEEAVRAIYKEEYGEDQFIRIFEPGGEYDFPETRWVKGSNFCDIGVKVDSRTGRIVVIAAIDNLVKGAAGQAIQSMNILFGLNEASGLRQLPVFPG